MSKNAAQQGFEQFQNFAHIDYSKVSDIFQKSLESTAKAQQNILEKAQEIAQAQIEFYQAQTEKLTKATSQALAAKTPEENLDRGQKFAQEQLDASIKNAQDLAKATSEATVESLDIINKQAVENLNELSKLAEAS